MVIALPYENHYVNPHFGKSKLFVFYKIENNEILSKEIIAPNVSSHDEIAEFLKKHNTDVVICGGIGEGAVKFLKDAGIKIYAGYTGYPDDLVQAYYYDELTENNTANCDHHHEDGEEGGCSSGGCGHCCH